MLTVNSYAVAKTISVQLCINELISYKYTYVATHITTYVAMYLQSVQFYISSLHELQNFSIWYSRISVVDVYIVGHLMELRILDLKYLTSLVMHVFT